MVEGSKKVWQPRRRAEESNSIHAVGTYHAFERGCPLPSGIALRQYFSIADSLMSGNKKQGKGNLSLYPLKFEEAVKGLLEVKPEPKKAKPPKIAQEKV